MVRVGVAVVGMMVVVLAGCGGDDDDGGGGGTVDAGGGDGRDDGPDAASGTPDAAPQLDAGPVNVQCAALPATLPGNDMGFRMDHGTLCFNPPGHPDPEDCRVTEQYSGNPGSYCSYGGILIGRFPDSSKVPGGELLLGFGFGTQIVDSDFGPLEGNRILQIPDGEFTVDFKGGFNSGEPSADTYRAVFTFNADDSVTVNSIVTLPQ